MLGKLVWFLLFAVPVLAGQQQHKDSSVVLKENSDKVDEKKGGVEEEPKPLSAALKALALQSQSQSQSQSQCQCQCRCLKHPTQQENRGLRDGKDEDR